MAESVPGTYAARVCRPCRLGKRGCDKLLPACSYCQRLQRPCYYDVDLSLPSVSEGTSTHSIKRSFPLLSRMGDVPSLDIRDVRPVSFTRKENQHDFVGNSDDRLILHEAKPRQNRRRQRLVTVCQHCRYLKKKCDRRFPTCSYCQKCGLQCSYNVRAEIPQTRDNELRQPAFSTALVDSKIRHMDSLGTDTVLGATLLDPFNLLPGNSLPPPILSHSIRYSLSTIVPLLIPPASTGSGENTALEWFYCIREDPSLLYAACFAALCHQHALEWMTESSGRSNNRNQYYAQLCLSESVRLLRQRVSNSNTQVSDSIILTVLILGTYTWELSPRARGQQPRNPFSPILKQMQWVDLYSAFMPDGTHITALVELLRLRGGLNKVSLPGLAVLLSYGYILRSVRRLSKPVVPFISLSRPFCTVPPTLLEMVGFDLEDVYRDFNVYRSFGWTEEMATVFEAVKVYGSRVIEYRHDLSLCRSVSQVIDQRNLIQYMILSLPPSNLTVSNADDNWKLALYECCRLALVIYSLSVVFPTSAILNSFETLVEHLYDVLETRFPIFITLAWTHAPISRVLQWVTTLGSIVAQDTSYQSKYSTMLHALLAEEHYRDFEDFKRSALEPILWIDTACDHAARDLWDSVVMV